MDRLGMDRSEELEPLPLPLRPAKTQHLLVMQAVNLCLSGS
jgi:hypothetical protein